MPYLDIQGEIPDDLEGFQSYQVYNVLDCAITAQLSPILLEQMDEEQQLTYERELRVQKLCLAMSTKGFPINQWALAELLYRLDLDAQKCLDRLHQFCEAVDYGKLNPRSPKQVAHFFYTHLRCSPQYSWDPKTKQRKLSTDAKALEKLRTLHPIAMPFIQAIFGYRELAKMASVFSRGLEPADARCAQHRLRCNFTPSGTETGRLSSQQNPYGRGTNAQNLTPRVRQVIAARPDHCLLNIDLKTAESIAVGYISRSISYIEACLGTLKADGSRTASDLHTTVAKLVWKNLPWTGDIRADRALAEQPFYRHFSYRDMSKRGGHGTNYYGTPQTMAMHLKVQKALIENFQKQYFASFPEIPEWHLETIARIQSEGKIVTALGRPRTFWGRPNDSATHREAIAFHPQSLVGDVMNEGLCQVQDWIIRANVPAELLAQVHDSGLFEVPISEVADITRELQQVLIHPVDFGDLGEMIIPSDASVGLTWGKPKGAKSSKYELIGQVDWTPDQPLPESWGV